MGLQELVCPYFQSDTVSRCMASSIHVEVNIRQIAAYCSSDDHDRCPLYLAKALQREGRSTASAWGRIDRTLTHATQGGPACLTTLVKA
jgi:hypothetical protein